MTNYLIIKRLSIVTPNNYKNEKHTEDNVAAF